MGVRAAAGATGHAPAIADPMALRALLAGTWVAQSIFVVARLGVADRLADGPRGCQELAAEVGADATALRRVLKALAGLGLFSSAGNGRFGLAPLGHCLRSDVEGSLRALAIWIGEVSHPVWGRALDAVRSGRPASGQAFGMPQFEYLAGNPEIAAVFHAAMAGLAEQVARAVVAAYDFSRFETVVDVGGGDGTLVAAILQASPHARGVVLDTEAAVEQAQRRLEAAGLLERCEMVAGDFFTAVPRGGDLYLLSSVLHDWDDERALAVLRSCRRAMEPASRLLVIECVLPPGDEPSFARLLDLQMLAMTGGRERTEEEYRALLAAAGFRLAGAYPTACPEYLIEALPI